MSYTTEYRITQRANGKFVPETARVYNDPILPDEAPLWCPYQCLTSTKAWFETMAEAHEALSASLKSEELNRVVAEARHKAAREAERNHNTVVIIYPYTRESTTNDLAKAKETEKAKACCHCESK